MPSSVVDKIVAGASDAEYRKLANALPQIIWTCDAQGRLEWVNDRWIELTGLSEAESLATRARSSPCIPTIGEELQRRFAEALATSTPVRDRVPDPEPGGRLSLSPLRGWCPSATRTASSRAGWPRPSTCTIAAQAEEALRASERRFETVFNLNPQPTAITRLADGVYLNVNDAFLKLTGFSREEVIGKTAVELGIWTAGAARRGRRAASARRRPPRAEIPYRTKDGRALTLLHRQRAHRFRRRALPGQRGDRRDRAARDRGRGAAERGAGARARRRAGGADGRGARRRLDRAGPRLPRDARQPDRARAACAATRGRTCRRRPPIRPPRGTSRCS